LQDAGDFFGGRARGGLGVGRLDAGRAADQIEADVRVAESLSADDGLRSRDRRRHGGDERGLVAAALAVSPYGQVLLNVPPRAAASANGIGSSVVNRSVLPLPVHVMASCCAATPYIRSAIIRSALGSNAVEICCSCRSASRVET